MANVNKVTLIGNLTRDPELRFTPKGTAVCDIGLAVNRIYKDDLDNKQEETTYIEITYWGRQAETLGEYLKKGHPLYIEGRLKLDTWTDKESGAQRSKMKVHGQQFQFLGGGGSPPNQADAGQENAKADPTRENTL